MIIDVNIQGWYKNKSWLSLYVGGRRRQRGSVVRVGDLYAEDPGSNPLLGLLNEFVLGDPRDKTHHAL